MSQAIFIFLLILITWWRHSKRSTRSLTTLWMLKQLTRPWEINTALRVIFVAYSAVPLKRGQFSQKYSQSTPMTRQLGRCMVCPLWVQHRCSSWVPTIIHAISYYIEPRHKGTRCTMIFRIVFRLIMKYRIIIFDGRYKYHASNKNTMTMLFVIWITCNSTNPLHNDTCVA